MIKKKSHKLNFISTITLRLVLNPLFKSYSFSQTVQFLKDDIIKIEKLDSIIDVLHNGSGSSFLSDAEESDNFNLIQEFAVYLDGVGKNGVNYDNVHKLADNFIKSITFSDAFISKIDNRIQYVLPILNN